jgi:hypothetical protein
VVKFRIQEFEDQSISVILKEELKRKKNEESHNSPKTYWMPSSIERYE